MTGLVQTYGYAAVFAFVGIESLGIPLPGETILVTAALYAGLGHHLSIAGIVGSAIAGAVIGDNVGYLVGHWGGYRLLLRYGPRIRIDQARVKVARYLFLRYGGAVVFFGRFVSVLRTYAAFLAGTTRMPWRRFFAFNLAGGVAWSAIYGFGAFALGREAERLSRSLTFAFAAVAVVAVIVVIAVLRRQEQRLAAEAERTFPGPLEPPKRTAARG